MNFTVKYHKPAQACMCLLGKPLQNWSYSNYYYRDSVPQKVCSYKDVNYETNQTIHDDLLHGINVSTSGNVSSPTSASLQANTAIFNGLTAYASSEKITDFDEDAYAVDDIVGTATQSFSYGYTSNTYTVSVSNASGQSDIKVNCLKFTKQLYEKANVSNNYNAYTPTCLMYSCYLDEEVTIPAGSEKVFTVVFNFLNA